jgi:hypothetical protein
MHLFTVYFIFPTTPGAPVPHYLGALLVMRPPLQLALQLTNPTRSFPASSLPSSSAVSDSWPLPSLPWGECFPNLSWTQAIKNHSHWIPSTYFHFLFPPSHFQQPGWTGYSDVLGGIGRRMSVGDACQLIFSAVEEMWCHAWVNI